MPKYRSATDIQASKRVPRWLSPQSLRRVVRPDRSTGNRHGLMTNEHMDVKWPLPLMFGAESYAFSIVDLTDDRFAQDAASMSANLAEAFQERQVIENLWRPAFKTFIETEKRRENLTAGVLQESIQKADEEFNQTRAKLLELQARRDEAQARINLIWDRCDGIKSTIHKEAELEKLRLCLNKNTEGRYSRDDPFWKSKFKIKRSFHAPLKDI